MNEFVFEINGMIDGYGYQRSNVRYLLKQNKGKKVRCKINSWGGSVNDAIAISKLFEEHGNVTVEFIGFCASAVTWMAFGAKTVEMHEDSLWLCHKSSIAVDVYGRMNADQLEAAIKQLENEKKNQDAIDLIIAKKYADKCADKGKTLADVLDLMKQERWLPASDVLEWGFIDTVIPGINKVSDEHRNLFIENCAALNLPVPTFAENKEEVVQEDIATRVINGIKGFFLHKDNNEVTITNIQLTMNKSYVPVNSLLGVEGLTENNGKIELTADQLQKISDALIASSTNEKAVKDATDALDGISDHIKSITGLTNKVNAVKAVMNMIPSGLPAGNDIPVNSKSTEYNESNADPVNRYFDKEED